MKQKFQVGNLNIIVQLGYNKIYNVKCPFDFMEMISLEGKTNFFEKRVGDYSLTFGVERDNTNFEFTDDF